MRVRVPPPAPMEFEKHLMEQIGTLDTGEEVYECFICGRKVNIIWSPYKKIVEVHGDQFAIHVGSQVVLGNPNISSKIVDNWESGLAEMNFEGLWKKKL